MTTCHEKLRELDQRVGVIEAHLYRPKEVTIGFPSEELEPRRVGFPVMVEEFGEIGCVVLAGSRDNGRSAHWRVYGYDTIYESFAEAVSKVVDDFEKDRLGLFGSTRHRSELNGKEQGERT